MTIEKEIKLLSWNLINEYNFKGKKLLKDVMVDRKNIKDIAKEPPHCFPDGTPVGLQTIRKKINYAMANLAIEMIKAKT